MLILERIKDGEAVISDGEGEFSVPADRLTDCREGDVLVLSGGVYIRDTEATRERRNNILKLQDSLWDD